MFIKANTATEVEEYPVIPSGTYPIKVIDVKVRESPSKGEWWSLQLEIQSGPYDGKFIFDSLFFTPKAINRFFLVWKRLTGFELDRTQDLQVQESDLLGCKGTVTVNTKSEEYNGETRQRTRVAYDGYAPFDIPAAAPATKKKSATGDTELDDIPF